jgi:hypothetical protein
MEKISEAIVTSLKNRQKFMPEALDANGSWVEQGCTHKQGDAAANTPDTMLIDKPATALHQQVPAEPHGASTNLC